MVDHAVQPLRTLGHAAPPRALARILTSCPCVTHATPIAVVGSEAATCQLALSAQGFAAVTAASSHGAAMLRERYGCLCLMDGPRVASLDAETLAMWRRRLLPGGTLALDVSLVANRDALATQLSALDFRMVQYRAHLDAVFLVARLPAAVPLRRAA
jgi:hypothetical protein